MITLPYGTFDVDPSDTWLESAVESGFWDHDLKQHFDAIPSGVNILEVGAHCGLYAGYFASRGCRVWSLEAHPLYWRRLWANIVSNGWEDRITPLCLYAYSRACALVEQREHPSGASNTWLPQEGTQFPHARMALPLDYLLPALPTMHTLKVDAQGADLHVLLGAENLIARDHPQVFIEYEGQLCARHGHTADDYRRWIAEHAYVEHNINGNNALLVWSGRGV